MTALPSPHEVESDCRRALALVNPNALLLETSTIDATLVRQLQSEVRLRVVALIDAGVSLGHPSDHGARLALWFGGDALSNRTFSSQLERLGEPTLYCGPTRSGKVVKLVSNAVAHSLLVLLSETSTTGVKCGVPLENLPHSLFRRDFGTGLRMELAGGPGPAVRVRTRGGQWCLTAAGRTLASGV